MELCAVIVGCYLGWVVLAIWPRKVVKLSPRILQDLLVLTGCSFCLPLLGSDVQTAVLTTLFALIMYNDLPSPWLGVNDRAVLITGCDQGLGHALALKLDTMGFQVFAGCLLMGGEGERKLVEKASSRLTTLQMDVSNQEQVLKAANTVAEKLGTKVLHGVVNNAGILLAGNMEIMAYSDIRKVMDVNCMGVINVYRAFMPLLRRPRRGTARLVNVASNIGLAPSALMGVYAASKASVAMLTETWRYEHKPMGIDVSTIIPSGFKTGILEYNKEEVGDRWWKTATQEVRDYFGRACFTPSPKRENYRDYLNADFSGITDCMADALLSTYPKPYYYKGLIARSIPFLYLHLPPWMWSLVMPYLSDNFIFPFVGPPR
ncbi:retinol dehydrogenase 7-like [Physella acuta]|uniref:retinol dehydrogenase 7-like n=1 Tax=Physella acuta TaxID=109671 RepID=UPI0027DC4B02|nr:retinol dehydrogenase 7-like [Physella acuta]